MRSHERSTGAIVPINYEAYQYGSIQFLNEEPQAANLSPEHELWMEVIKQALLDIETNNQIPCKQCHDIHKCPNKVSMSYATHREPYMKHDPNCLGHTLAECAKLWLHSPDFDEICLMIGVNSGYIRRQVKL